VRGTIEGRRRGVLSHRTTGKSMKTTRIFSAWSVCVALAVACGGSTSNPSGDGSPDSGSGAGGGIGSSGGGSSGTGQDADMSRDGGAACQCLASQACCVAHAAGATTFSCAANQNPCPTGTTTVACTSSQSCGSGQECCDTALGGATSGDCSMGMVCCQGGGQTCHVQSACGMPGNREICATSADCPTSFPVCRGMTCRVAPDGGAPRIAVAPRMQLREANELAGFAAERVERPRARSRVGSCGTFPPMFLWNGSIARGPSDGSRHSHLFESRSCGGTT
jgi:hypothetical protein